MNGIVQLRDGLWRLTAPNPGPMTGAGTNTYLLGRDRFVVVDPGPAIESHIDTLWQAVEGRLEAILVTHTHHDHSPAAAILAERSGAALYGKLSSNLALQDPTFKPDVELAHQQRLDFEQGSVRVLHTPGHVDNHFCFLLEEHGILLAGDHIMQGSTVVIVPPQGDMAAYIDSLRQLSCQPLAGIAPAHGDLMPQPLEVIEQLIAHRLRREQKVCDRLAAFGQLDFSALLAQVYDEVDPRLHVIARHSLLAHLLKLESENKVVRSAALQQDELQVSTTSNACDEGFNASWRMRESCRRASPLQHDDN